MRATTLLGIMLISASLLSIGMVSYFLLKLVRSELRQEATRRNTMLAASIAHETGNSLSGFIQSLRILTDSEFANNLGIQAVAKAFPEFEYIEISDFNGQVYANTATGSHDAFDISKRDYFLKTVEASTAQVSATFISERTYQPTAVLSVSGSDRIVAGHLNLRSLTDYITGIEEHDYRISVIDDHGYYIANTDSEAVYRRDTIALQAWYSDARKTMSGSRFHTENGLELFTTWSATSIGSWLIVISQPASSILEEAHRLQRSIALVIIVFLIISIGITLLIIRYIAKDIQLLTRHTQQLAAGNYEAALHYSGFSDFNPLAENFDLMFEAVRHREENLKQNERQISASLKEKEILLKEIHHRVKNNLQLVISLLSLKAGGNENYIDLFADSIDRIRVMSMIHEMLYKTENLAELNLAEYMKTITEHLLDNFSGSAQRPVLKANLQMIQVDIDTAIPCGLIINELLTNSLKYGRSKQTDSLQLLITLNQDADRAITLDIADNGPGLPPDYSPEHSNTLGMQLILSLTDQLGGSWQLDGTNGTRWIIHIPDRNRKNQPAQYLR